MADYELLAYMDGKMGGGAAEMFMFGKVDAGGDWSDRQVSTSCNRLEVEMDCNESLQQFCSWCSSNRLSINISKNSFLYFSNSAPPNNLGDVAINGTPLEKRSSVDFLGVVMDEKLKFNLHVDKIAGKISKNSGILYKLRPFLPADSLKSIYYSFVYCCLNYCPIIFGNAYESHLKPLNVAQKKCIRLISNKKQISSYSSFICSS